MNVAIQANGSLFWDDKPVDEATLNARIAQAAQQNPQPEIHMRADRTVAYEKVADLMSAAQSGGSHQHRLRHRTEERQVNGAFGRGDLLRIEPLR